MLNITYTQLYYGISSPSIIMNKWLSQICGLFHQCNFTCFFVFFHFSKFYSLRNSVI